MKFTKQLFIKNLFNQFYAQMLFVQLFDLFSSVFALDILTNSIKNIKSNLFLFYLIILILICKKIFANLKNIYDLCKNSNSIYFYEIYNDNNNRISHQNNNSIKQNEQIKQIEQIYISKNIQINFKIIPLEYAKNNIFSDGNFCDWKEKNLLHYFILSLSFGLISVDSITNKKLNNNFNVLTFSIIFSIIFSSIYLLLFIIHTINYYFGNDSQLEKLADLADIKKLNLKYVIKINSQLICYFYKKNFVGLD